MEQKMSKMVSRHTPLLTSVIETPLGRVMLAGEHHYGLGTEPRGKWRLYGSFAIVFVTGGSGLYRDTNGLRRELTSGDAIIVFPDLAHCYGPRTKAERWDELYLTFDGPVFALFRKTGLLDATQPIQPLGPAGLELAARLREWIVTAASSASDPERLQQITRLLSLLTEALTPKKPPEPHAASWLADATMLLKSELARSVPISEIAARVNLPYETFRKRFTEAVGVSPARYRTEQRIAAACQLLRFTPQVTNRQLAEALGFADEFHFSKRFKEITGETPRKHRMPELKTAKIASEQP
jgi:AraC-like DNA-binding protein